MKAVNSPLVQLSLPRLRSTNLHHPLHPLNKHDQAIVLQLSQEKKTYAGSGRRLPTTCMTTKISHCTTEIRGTGVRRLWQAKSVLHLNVLHRQCALRTVMGARSCNRIMTH